MKILLCCVILLFAYLIGSIPFGYLIAKARGVDLTAVGSGNIGATNLGRIFGRKWFAVCLILDACKGTLATCAAGAILATILDRHWWVYFLLWISSGAAAILGHTFSIFLGFRGGKAVATSLGVALGVFPYFTVPALITFSLWWVVLLAAGYISVASIAGAVAFPVIYFITNSRAALDEQMPLLVFCSLMTLLIVWRHGDNIRRLKDGTESKASFLLKRFEK